MVLLPAPAGVDGTISLREGLASIPWVAARRRSDSGYHDQGSLVEMWKSKPSQKKWRISQSLER